jgi:hypothetical protein
MSDGLTTQFTDGFDTCDSSTTYYAEGNNSNLVFDLPMKAKSITSVSNWVSGSNSWGLKTLTTHYTVNTASKDSQQAKITYESGQAPIAKVAQVDTITCDTKANHGAGDHLIFYSKSGLAYGVWLKKVAAAVAQVDVLTCDTKANTVDRDFFVSIAVDGTKYAVYLDKTGTSEAPTSARYTECDQKVKADVSGATTAADIATIVAAAFNGLTGFTTDETIVDNADGTLTFTQDTAGECAEPKDYAYNSTTAGSASGAYAWSQTTDGDAIDVEPTGALWLTLATARKAVANVSADTTAAQVAATVRAAVAAITGIGTYITVGTVSTASFPLTQVTVGDCEDPVDYESTGTTTGAFTIVNTTYGKTYTMKVILVQASNQMYSELSDGL